MNIPSDTAARYARMLGILSIFPAVIFNFLSGFLPPGGAGLIIGIAAIAFAFVSKENGHMPKAAKTGIITAIIGLMIAFFIFFSTMVSYQLLRSPKYAQLYNKVFEDYQNGQTPDYNQLINELDNAEKTAD